MAADDRWAARAGWDLTAERVAKSPDGLDLPALLARIEAEMANADPEVQWTMNNTLASIGIHFPKHRKRAIAIGETLGRARIAAVISMRLHVVLHRLPLASNVAPASSDVYAHPPTPLRQPPSV